MSAIPKHWQVVASGRGGGGPPVHNPRDWRTVDPARGLRRSVGGSPYFRRVQTKVVPVNAWSHNNSPRMTSGNRPRGHRTNLRLEPALASTDVHRCRELTGIRNKSAG